ncbi:unnamed protein product [Cochlearia groenlandica]
MYFDRGNFYDFTSLVRELDVPGEIYERKTYPFEFSTVEMPYETYNGVNVRLRYVLKVTVTHAATVVALWNIKTLWSVTILHNHQSITASRYHMKDVILGKIYFLLVRIKIKNMDLEIRLRESTGA